jgi:Protein of unknown function (DUF2769)
MVVVAKSKENLKKCRCFCCPSYSWFCKMKSAPSTLVSLLGKPSPTERLENMFCAYENSCCIKIGKGCICFTCRVFKANGLKKGYYCLSRDGK